MLSIAHPAGRRCPLSPPSLLHPGIPLPATLPRPSLPFLLYSRDTYMLYTCSSPTLSVHTQRSRMKTSRPTPSPSPLHSHHLRVNRCLMFYKSKLLKTTDEKSLDLQVSCSDGIVVLPSLLLASTCPLTRRIEITACEAVLVLPDLNSQDPEGRNRRGCQRH